MELALLDFDNTLTNSNGVLLDKTIQDIKNLPLLEKKVFENIFFIFSF